MNRKFSRFNAVLLAVLLCASVMPQNAAADETTTTEHFAFGIEYDWSNMNDDFETMTGLPLDDILSDIMQSADDAGIDLLILEEVTGTSSVIIDQYEDGTMMLDYDGSTVEVTKHITELTIRHGDMMDMAMITQWSDAYAGWDLTISGGTEGIFNVDAHYTEYRDTSGLIYGHDIVMSMDTDNTIFFDLEGHLEADDGDKVMPLDIHMSMGVDYSVNNAESQVLYSEPSTLYQELSALEGGDTLYWQIGEDDDDDYEDDEYSDDYYWVDWTYCEWEGEGWSGDERFYCTDNSDGSNGFDDWWYYCEYYSDWDSYKCTDDFGQNSDWEYATGNTHYADGTSPHDDDHDDHDDHDHDDHDHGSDEELYENAEPHDGVFSTTTGFEFELTGLPAEQMGMPAGKWDVSASDSTSDSGVYEDEDYFCEMGIELFEGTQMITTDDGQLEVMQAYTSPLPWGMTCHIANLFIHAFEGTEDAATLEDMIADSTEEIAESMGGSSESWAESNQMSIDVYAHNQDEIEVYVSAWDLEENTDYEVTMVMTDSDGITQDATSMVVYDDYYFSDYDYMSTAAWGEHCVTAQLKDVTNNDIVDSVTTCTNVEQQPEPSDLVIDIIEGFSDSTLDNVMENFGSNLEYRMENYEADFPYDDGDMFVLWDANNNMVVGFQLVVTSDDSNMWYTLVGPESDSYGTAPNPISVTYFSGQQAIEQEAEIEDYSTLEDLVDLTQHNDEIIEEAIEEATADYDNGDAGEETGEETGEEASGLLPFISPALTIAMIAAAGLVASLQSRRDQASIETSDRSPPSIMREGKPYAKLLLHLAQFVVLFSLIQAVNTQVWYTGVVDIEYTDGLPAGAGMEVELEVDQKTADGSIHIDGFITFMQWQNSRNDTTIDSTDSEDYDRESMDFTPLSEIQEDVPILAKIAFSLGVLLLGLTFFQVKYRALIGLALNGLVIWIMISLIVLAPLGYIGGMDFGAGSFDDDEGESTVHQSTEGSPSIDLLNGELEYVFTTKSYDLGLADKSELDDVIANPPGKEHRTYLEMDGVAGIHYSPFVVELAWAWLVLFFVAPTGIGFFNRIRIEKPQLL